MYLLYLVQVPPPAEKAPTMLSPHEEGLLSNGIAPALHTESA